MHAGVLQLGHDCVVHDGRFGGVADHRDRPALQGAFLSQQLDQDRRGPFGNGARGDHEAGGRFIDDRLREVVGHQHPALLVRDAGLRRSGEVDEGPDDREHVVVLREGCAHRTDPGCAERRVVLVVGNDLAAVDAAMGVDVVDVDLVDLLLLRVRADLVGVLLDRREIDERDPDLDRRFGYAGSQRLVDRPVRVACRRCRCARSWVGSSRTTRAQREHRDNPAGERHRCATPVSRSGWSAPRSTAMSVIGSLHHGSRLSSNVRRPHASRGRRTVCRTSLRSEFERRAGSEAGLPGLRARGDHTLGGGYGLTLLDEARNFAGPTLDRADNGDPEGSRVAVAFLGCGEDVERDRGDGFAHAALPRDGETELPLRGARGRCLRHSARSPRLQGRRRAACEGRRLLG